MPRARNYLLGTLAALAGLIPSPAAAGPTFADNSFNLADYTIVGPNTSDGSISVSYAQCATCGNPGEALQLVVTVPTSGKSDIGFLNNNFTYDPSVQGALSGIYESEDKDLTTTSSGTFTTDFRSLIYQNGNYYISGIPFPSFTGPGTTGYQTASGTLSANDFTLYDFLTFSFGTGHPDFSATGSNFELGIVFIGNNNSAATNTTEFDNLLFSLIPVPEPSSWMLMLLGFSAIGMAARRQKRREVSLGYSYSSAAHVPR
ncbi:MAG: PEPxxWA-CTERM sorting domain-containing protein [Sphingomicrobium sp.]